MTKSVTKKIHHFSNFTTKVFSSNCTTIFKYFSSICTSFHILVVLVLFSKLQQYQNYFQIFKQYLYQFSKNLVLYYQIVSRNFKHFSNLVVFQQFSNILVLFSNILVYFSMISIFSYQILVVLKYFSSICCSIEIFSSTFSSFQTFSVTNYPHLISDVTKQRLFIINIARQGQY